MSWFERVPKVELHVHLEGAIPLPTLWTLVEKYGGDPAVPDRAALEARFAYRDFPHFIDTWVWKNRFLREYDDFTLIAAAVAADLARQSVRYAEVFYSPPDFARHGLAPQRLTAAIRAGLDQVPAIEIALVADLVRDFGPARGATALEQIAEVRDQGVIGIGIGGSEQAFPPEPFAAVFERARELGLRTSAHAGEAAGPASIWGAIRALRVDRIGHGTRAIEDDALVAHLAAHRIPLELCPGSNVKTGVVASIAAHPARRLYDAGIPLSINTDDPAMFGTALATEYAELERALGFDRDDIRRLIESAIQTSWLPAPRRHALLAEFRADPAWTG